MMLNQLDTALCTSLVDDGDLASDRYDVAKEYAQQDDTLIFEQILNRAYVQEETLFRAMAKVLEVSFIKSVSEFTIVDYLADSMKQSMLTNKFLPIRHEDRIKFLIASLHTSEIEDAIRQTYGDRIVFAVCTRSFLESQLDTGLVNLKVNKLGQQLINSIDDGIRPDALVSGALDSDVAGLFDQIVEYGLKYHASDIHIFGDEGQTVIDYTVNKLPVRGFRVDGAALNRLNTFISTYSNQPDTAAQHIRDGQISYKMKGKTEVRLRISFIPSHQGVSIVLRILENKYTHLDQLGISKPNLDKIYPLIKKSQGLVIICGPVNSGKSTTALSMVAAIRETGSNVYTIEDPVEQVLPGVVQVNYNAEAGVTFETASRAFLRHNMNAEYIGEIRDGAVAESVAYASNTGHLVLSTTHVSRALHSLIKLVDLGVTPFTVSEALIAMIGQRLLPRLCDNCKQEHVEVLPNEVCDLLKLEQGKPVRYYTKTGCSHCHKIGYSAVVPINEVILMTPELKLAASKDATIDTLSKVAYTGGFHSISDDAIDRFKAGLISLNDAISVVSDIEGVWMI